MFLYSKQIFESHLSKENMTQPSSMFIDGKIIEMPSVKFFLKHPVGLTQIRENQKYCKKPNTGIICLDFYQ